MSSRLRKKGLPLVVFRGEALGQPPFQPSASPAAEDGATRRTTLGRYRGALRGRRASWGSGEAISIGYECEPDGSLISS
jgi:hypothetical protein